MASPPLMPHEATHQSVTDANQAVSSPESSSTPHTPTASLLHPISIRHVSSLTHTFRQNQDYKLTTTTTTAAAAETTTTTTQSQN